MAIDVGYNVRLHRATLTATDTAATLLATLPQDAIIEAISVFTETQAIGATMDIGIAGNTDSYVDGLDVSAVGSRFATLLSGSRLTAATPIYGLVANPAGGPFNISIWWTTLKSTRMV
jgi:hypothetical protein